MKELLSLMLALCLVLGMATMSRCGRKGKCSGHS